MGLLTGGLGGAMEHGYVDYYPDVPPVYTYEYAVSDETFTGQNKKSWQNSRKKLQKTTNISRNLSKKISQKNLRKKNHDKSTKNSRKINEKKQKSTNNSQKKKSTNIYKKKNEIIFAESLIYLGLRKAFSLACDGDY